MAQSYFPMLPKIDVAQQGITLDQSGVWKTNNREFLQKLATSLATGETLEDVGNIDSIPDIWAKPLLFKMALFDLETTREFVAGLHDRVLGEWRALLAMLALQNVKQINLRAELVDLTEETMPLAQVLRELVPQESFLGNKEAWLKDTYVIFYNGKPLAMTSPTTLVAAGADYCATFKGNLEMPWSTNKKTLSDPIQHLTRDELIALHAWLEQLYNNLRTASQKSGLNTNSQDISNSLLKCIKNYQDDVGREIGATHADVSVNFISSNLKLDLGLARYLNLTVQGREASIDDSAVRLLVNSSRTKKNLLLISPAFVKDFARQEGVDPARLVIWQGVSANDVTDKSLQSERNKINRINLKNAEFRCPEDFFYEQMAVVEPGNAFPGSLEIAGTIVLADDSLTPILPIKRELLEIFTPKEIQSRLSISEDNDNILMHFNFPLSGVTGTGTEFRFTKKYPKRDLIYIQQEVPVIELWPNIRREGWQKYYLYYENYQAQATGKGVSELPVDEMYYVEPWTFGKELDKDYPARGLKNCLTAKLDSFPEALICNYKAPNSGSAFEIGLILLDTPEPIQRQVCLDWKIGVDFGTSSTMLYYSENKKQPTPLDFEPRLFKVTESGGARAQTFINFIASNPPTRPDGSFLSIFHLRNSTGKEIRPLQDGNVLSFIRRDIFEQLGHRIDSNLKWKEDDLGRRKVGAYVRQICMQALVEATAKSVDHIQWNFSYPTAFSQEKKSTFAKTCLDGIKDVYENSGFDINPNKDVAIWSESEASAYYFNKLNQRMGVNFTDGAICIDIGAGTTDISVISGQPAKIVYHTSIQYAGRYMFKPIYDNYELFADSKTAYYVQLEDEEQRDALIDTDMRQHSEEYLKDLVNKTGQESVKSVLQGAQFATAGLFYYLGQLLAFLHSEQHYKEDNLPDIFIGGNGSRIFEWITGGTELEDNPRLAVLEKMLTDASGLNNDRKFKLNFSHYPKVEVASGMITSKPPAETKFFDEQEIYRALFKKDAQDEFICNSVLSGAEYLKDSKPTEPLSFLNAHDIRKGIRITSTDKFVKFVECFNDAPGLWSDDIPFDRDAAVELIKGTNSFFVGLRGADEKKIFVEPVFIVELKYLMEMFRYGE